MRTCGILGGRVLNVCIIYLRSGNKAERALRLVQIPYQGVEMCGVLSVEACFSNQQV